MDITSLERAATRLVLDPTLLDRLGEEVTRLSKAERLAHPHHEHWREVDGLMSQAKYALRDLEPPERLLELERLVVLFKERLERAEDARKCEYGRAVQVSAAARQAIIHFGPVGTVQRAPALTSAVKAVQDRLEDLRYACPLTTASEEALSEWLDDLELVSKSLTNSIAIERRDSRIRIAAERAQAAATDLDVAA